MATSKTISYQGETRTITIDGNPGAEFELYVKQGTDYYNWDTDAFQSTVKILTGQEIPTNGIYTKNVVIPKVTADTSYDFYMRALSGTTSYISTTHEQKIGVLYQKGVKTATFTATESASTLVVQNTGSTGADLTGGTLTDTRTTLTQIGTITEDSGYFVYCHSVPSWDRATGGDWTLSNTVSSTIQSSSGAVVYLTEDGGTNVVVGDSVTGGSIVDEVTVSAVSGDKIALSSAQNLADGQALTFSEEAWEIGPLSATVANTSGTASILLKTSHNITKTGIADVTCVLDIDSHFSVKPNAFPVTGIECPAGGSVRIYPIEGCTNYLGQLGDNDANVASKTYRVHSVPTTGTASRPSGKFDANGDEIYITLGDIVGTSSVSAGAVMGDAGAALVTYTANASMIAGDTDYFYYKTIDAQATPVTSSTTQGKISITIV